MDFKIKLKQLQVTNVNLSAGTYDERLTAEPEVDLHFYSAFADDDVSFAIMFDCTLRNDDGSFLLEVKATAHFETDKIVTQEFKDSPFVNINAPAIAFPYLRTFVSNLTLNSGYKAIIMPSFNFIKFVEDKTFKELSEKEKLQATPTANKTTFKSARKRKKKS